MNPQRRALSEEMGRTLQRRAWGEGRLDDGLVGLARLLVQRGPVVESTPQAITDELGSVFVSRMLRNFDERGWVKLDRERVAVVAPRALQALSRK